MKKELAKPLINTAIEFIKKVVSPPLEEYGELLKDKVKYWRFKNTVNIILKAKQFLKEKHIEPRKVPPKIVIPLLQNSFWEEDSDMQTKWASLLANAANPNNLQYNMYSVYVEILNQISPLEAKILDSLYNKYLNSSSNERNSIFFQKSEICKLFDITPEDFDILADNLFRLNLLQPPAKQAKDIIVFGYHEDSPVALRTYAIFQFTPLGCDFVRQCRFQ